MEVHVPEIVVSLQGPALTTVIWILAGITYLVAGTITYALQRRFGGDIEDWYPEYSRVPRERKQYQYTAYVGRAFGAVLWPLWVPCWIFALLAVFLVLPVYRAVSGDWGSQDCCLTPSTILSEKIDVTSYPLTRQED